MAPREKRDKVFNSKIRQSVYDAIKATADRKGISMADVLEDAIEGYADSAAISVQEVVTEIEAIKARLDRLDAIADEEQDRLLNSP